MFERCLPQGLLIVTLLVASSFCASQDPSWNNLKQIAISTPVRVVLNTKKSVKGNFQSVTDDAVVVRSGGGDQTLSRSTVKLVTARSSAGHRGRNVLIGAAIGAGAGLGTGAAIDGDCSKSSFICTGPYGKEILTPAGGVIGAIIGALVPSHSWHEIYRSNQVRSFFACSIEVALPIVHHGVLETGLNFIQKPFTLETLANQVRTVLDGEV